MGPNAEVFEEINKAKKEEKKAAANAPLNFIGALRDDPERQRFVIKTYTIVSIMLGFTVAVCAVVNSDEEIKQWVRDYYWLHYVCLVVGIAIMCTLVCCMKHARIVPRNYILLGIFTVVWSYMVAGFTQWFESDDILIAASIHSFLKQGPGTW
jgi:FtsH-binding integral membrane protein